MQVASPRRSETAPAVAAPSTRSGLVRALRTTSASAQGSWVRVAMVLTVCGVFGLAWFDLRRNQLRAFADFNAVQATLSRAAAASIAARLEGVASDLTSVAAATAVSRAASLAVMARVVERRADGGLYRQAELFDHLSSGGVVVAELHRPDRPLPPLPPSLLALRQDLLARLARAPSGEVMFSMAMAPSESMGEQAGVPVQLCGVRENDQAVVLWLVAARIFDGIGGASGQAPSRWLAFDRAARRWLSIGTPGPGAWLDEPTAARAELVAVAEQAQRGEQGAIPLPPEVALDLRLAPRTAVAGYAPVRFGTAEPWSIAVVASAQRQRDRARLSFWRLAGSTSVAALLVGLFGVVLSRQERRERGLAEKLRLAAATASLRERSEKIVETIPVGVLALSRQGGAERVTAVNPYLLDRGVRSGGDLATALPHTGPAGRARLEELVAEARNAGRPGEHLGLRLRLDGDDLREVDAYAVPLRQPLPDADCFVLIHDRTEVRALERSLMRAEKLATIGTLAAGVAHEVGTPLGIISGRAEQLLGRVTDGDAGEAERRGLASILTQVDRVSSTIRQLLDFARPRAIETQAVAPASLLESAASLLEHRFRQAGVALHVSESPSPLPAVQADVGQLEQALVNLLLNACDACSEGGQVTARVFPRGDQTVFEIGDSGSGIVAENLPRVLDPFFTTKKRGQGTGLGLSIVADIVKNHGGLLEIESEVGKGTTVRILLRAQAAWEVRT